MPQARPVLEIESNDINIKTVNFLFIRRLRRK